MASFAPCPQTKEGRGFRSLSLQLRVHISARGVPSLWLYKTQLPKMSPLEKSRDIDLQIWGNKNFHVAPASGATPQFPPPEPLWSHLTLHPPPSSLFKINSWPLSCLGPLLASESDNSWWLLLCGSPYFCTLPYTGTGICPCEELSPRLACLTVFRRPPGPCETLSQICWPHSPVYSAL